MSYGEGSIFKIKNKKTGKEEIYVEVQIGLKANGKPRTTRRRARDKQHAIEIRRDLNNQKAEGGIDSQDNVTLADFGQNWIRNIKNLILKPSVATDYESRLRNHVFPYLGKTKVRELTFKKANWWINQMLNDGYSVSTINGARRVFAMVCKHAQRLELLKQNPVALTDPLKRQIGDKTQVCPAWTLEEAQRALAVAENTEFDLFINIGVRLGLRHGEILGLAWSAVDLEKNEIKVLQTLKDERRLDDNGNGIVRQRMQTPKTLSSVRTLKITDQLRDSITRHQMFQSVVKAKAQGKWKQTGLVFTTSIGTPRNQTNNRKRYVDLLSKAGVRYVRVHDMRHTFAGLALEAGAPLEAVSQSLGHADIGITKKIYAPNVKGLNAKAIDIVDNFLNPELTVPQSWTLGSEPISTKALEITDPVQLSKRPVRARLQIKGQHGH
jgi:integrase